MGQDAERTSEKYPASIRVLHWLIALAIIGLLTVGLVMTGLSRDNPMRATLYSLHKSFGITVLVLALIRLLLRLRLGVPPLPDIIPALERRLANLGHLALYGFMLAMPLSGMLMTNSFGFPAKWFGVSLPRLVGTDKARGAFFADFHAYAAYTLMFLIAIHVCAVIKHYVKDRLNLLKRMI